MTIAEIRHNNVIVVPIDGPTPGLFRADGVWAVHDEICETTRITVTKPLFDKIPTVEIPDIEELDPELFWESFEAEDYLTGGKASREAVYFGIGLITGLVKIGYSKCWSFRKSAYVTESAEPIEFVVVPGCKELERAMHLQFEAARISGKREWFYPHPSIISYMLKIG